MDSANLPPTGTGKTERNAKLHKTGSVKTDNPELTAKSLEGISIPNHWSKLDEDSLAYVLGYLDLKSAWRLSCTCKFFRNTNLMLLIPKITRTIRNYSYTSRVAIVLAPQICDEDKNGRITQLVGEAITKIDQTDDLQKQLFELMFGLMKAADYIHPQLPLSSSNPAFDLFDRLIQKFDECNWEDIITKVTKKSLNDSGCVWIDDNQSMLALKNLVLADAPRFLALAQTTKITHEEFEEWITACINEENFLEKTPIQKLAALVDSFIRHVVSAS